MRWTGRRRLWVIIAVSVLAYAQPCLPEQNTQASSPGRKNAAEPQLVVLKSRVSSPEGWHNRSRWHRPPVANPLEIQGPEGRHNGDLCRPSRPDARCFACAGGSRHRLRLCRASSPGCLDSAVAIPEARDLVPAYREVVLASLPSQSPARIEGHAELAANVGMMARIQQIVLPGSELISRPTDSHTAPVVIRIDAVYPHGDGFRYDLTWSAYEPGTHDLTKYLARKDGTSADDLPSLIVSATATLPPERVAPNAPDSQPRTSVGGYRTLLWLGGFLWAAVLLALLFARKNAPSDENQSIDNSPQSRLDVIRSLLTSAVSGGEFSAAEKARLEGLIVGFWREHKHIQELPAQKALTTLRNDPDAGPLLTQLERWLYDRPQPEQFDLHALLLPLQEMVSRAEEPQT